jgi:hypothetical protein
MSVISPLVSEVSSTPLTACIVPTALRESLHLSSWAIDAAIVTGGGVKSIEENVAKRWYRYPPIAPKMATSKTIVTRYPFKLIPVIIQLSDIEFKTITKSMENSQFNPHFSKIARVSSARIIWM